MNGVGEWMTLDAFTLFIHTLHSIDIAPLQDAMSFSELIGFSYRTMRCLYGIL